jgi:hypothetical protein
VGGLGGASSLGTLEDTLRKKVWVRPSLSAGAPLLPGNPVGGVGSYTEDFDIPWESLTRNFQRQSEGSGKGASLFAGALLGGGGRRAHLPGTLRCG